MPAAALGTPSSPQYKPLDVTLPGLDLEFVSANKRAFSDQTRARLGGRGDTFGGPNVDGSPAPPDVVGLAWPTNLWERYR